MISDFLVLLNWVKFYIQWVIYIVSDTAVYNVYKSKLHYVRRLAEFDFASDHLSMQSGDTSGGNIFATM